MPAAPRAADILARRLAAAGVRYAFGLPGGEVLTLVDALQGAGIHFVLATHENAAAFMAEGVWSATGAPGVMVATLGPGAMNGVNAIANAFQDRVPLVVLTGCADPDTAARYTHQVMDHRAVFASITKDSVMLTANSADVLTDRAITTAMASRPGPVHIDVPIGVAAAATADRGLTRVAPAATVPAEGAALSAAKMAIERAKRPVILAGLDIVNEAAGPALLTLAERLGAPIITTYRAKGAIDERHPLALGAAGLSPAADRVLLPLFAEADLIIAAGYDPIEMRTGWQDPWDASRQTVVEIFAEDLPHYMHTSTFAFRAALSPTLSVLTAARKAAPTEPHARLAEARAGLSEVFAETAGWGPGTVIRTCAEHLPAETRASVDSGAHRILLSQLWRCTFARGLLQSTGLCTMGCAIPLAAGAKLAEPERPVVAFTGDAGFLMVAGELATLADLRLPIPVIVFVDASLALIEMKQRARQLQNVGVDFAQHDFAAIGRAFGGNGITVRDRQGLGDALEAALASDRFTVIAAIIERGSYDGLI